MFRTIRHKACLEECGLNLDDYTSRSGASRAAVLGARERSIGWEGAAFTLLEIIGVLAIISVLAALLLPRIFAAMDSARVNHAALSIDTLKTASAQHVVKFGQLAVDGTYTPASPILLDGTDGRALQFDRVLLGEQLIDSPFSVRVGDRIVGPANTRIQMFAAVPPGTVADGTNAAFDLDATGPANDASGAAVLVAVITGVSLEDARQLNRVLDGSSSNLGEDAAGNDYAGRVKYKKPAQIVMNNAPARRTGARSAARLGNGNSGNNPGNGSGNEGNGTGSNGNGNSGGNSGNNGNGSGNNGNGNGSNGTSGNNGNGNGGNNGNGGSGGNSGGETPTQPANPYTTQVMVYLTHR